MDPKTKHVPEELFEKCKGVVVVTAVHVGAFVVLYYGTGVVVRKTETGWSAPSAVSVGGTNIGAVAGGKRDNSLIFILDDETMKDFAERPQTRIGLDAAMTAGKAGGDANVGMDHGTRTFSFTQGAYAGLSMQMGTLEKSDKQNHIFYGKEVNAKGILFKDDVTVPEDSQVPDLHDKLQKLANGETWTPGDEDIKSSRHYLEKAHESSRKLMSEA